VDHNRLIGVERAAQSADAVRDLLDRTALARQIAQSENSAVYIGL